MSREVGETASLEVSPEVSPVIWMGIVPPKVEIFLWQLSKGRTLVSEVLCNFGMVQMAFANCPLCGGDGSESINHLFLHCVWSWRLWSATMSWWEISNGDFSSWWAGWMSFCSSKSKARAWNVLFSAVCWTIWEVQNSLVFGGKKAFLSLALDSICFRVVWWFKNLRGWCYR